MAPLSGGFGHYSKPYRGRLGRTLAFQHRTTKGSYLLAQGCWPSRFGPA